MMDKHVSCLTPVTSKLREAGQEHLLAFFDTLPECEQNALLERIAQTDLELPKAFLRSRKENAPAKRGTITPLPAMKLSEIAERKSEFEEAGLTALHEGKAAAVLLAGGSGSRLGHDGPKGSFDIGITRPVYIFQRILESLHDASVRAERPLRIFIMTSDANDEATRAFFEEHAYFGYPQEYVHFFRQAMAPAVDDNGKILMESASCPVSAPNGNGGWLLSLERAGLLSLAKKEGIEWLNVFGVDNVLQKVCDPAFIGATLISGLPAGAKVTEKTSPDERVGVMCLEDGKPSVIEYFEMSEEMRNAKDDSGEYAYYYGVILNYLFRIADASAVMHREMPLHFAHKKIPCLDSAGREIHPAEPNGWKMEYFIFDLLHELDGCLPFEVERAKEFSPVKNRTGEDSVETARAMLAAQGIAL